MTEKLSERLRDGAASLAENWGFADHAALHSEAADALDAQAARIEVLEAENARLKKALHQIAAFDDTHASERLARTGRYSWFDEPGSVQIARAALGGNDG